MLLLFILYVIHNLFIVFVAFGFLLPSKYLIYYVFCWPIMLLHWTLNDNNCFMTQLQNYIKHESSNKTIYERVSSRLNISIEHAEMLVIYGITFIWTIAIIRLLRYYL